MQYLSSTCMLLHNSPHFSNVSNPSKILLDVFVLPLLSLMPNWPNLLRPHPNTAPDRVSTKLWAPPAAICANGIPSRDWMTLGEALLLPTDPNPSCPYLFWPQEYTLPPVGKKRKKKNTHTKKKQHTKKIKIQIKLNIHIRKQGEGSRPYSLKTDELQMYTSKLRGPC